MFCSRKEGLGPLVYFDCNATTPTLPRAAEAAWKAMRETFGNPSSVHTSGLQARQILLEAHELAARSIGVGCDDVVFTSGATEGIQMAVLSALSLAADRRNEGQALPPYLLYGATEHKAVPQALHHWNRILGLNFEIKSIPVLSNGLLDLEFLSKNAGPSWFIATMAVNNETGVFQDLDAVRQAIRGGNSDALWMVDCVQGLGKLPLDFSRIDANYAVFSGHKLYAPKGIGFFYFRKGSPLVPLIVGGGQERGLRSGTENIPGVAAFLDVLRLLENNEGDVFVSHDALVEYRQLLANLLQELFPEVVFNSPFENSVPTCLNFSVPGFASREILDAFDAAGVRVSAGSACSATRAAQSHVLDAMGFPQWRSAGAVRLSFGPATTRAELERGVERIRLAAGWLCGQAQALQKAPVATSDIDGVFQFRDGYLNSWCVVDEATKSMVVIDPGMGTVNSIKRMARKANLTIKAILFTHHHVGEKAERERWLSDLWPEALPVFVKNPLSSSIFVSRIISGRKCALLPLGAGERSLAVFSLPGHTADGFGFLIGDTENSEGSFEARFAFLGDLLLTNGLGRSDAPGASGQDIFHSLRAMASLLSSETIVCPAHDYTDTLATSWLAECHWNSLLKAALTGTESSFVALKSEADRRITDNSECAHWMADREASLPAPWMASDEEMSVTNGMLEASSQSASSQYVAIDVRESYEHAFLKEDSEVSFADPVRNIPLSRFANFMSECLRQKPSDSQFVFVCRSGGRALQAARSFRLVGYSLSWSLAGGVACGCESHMSV